MQFSRAGSCMLRRFPPLGQAGNPSACLVETSSRRRCAARRRRPSAPGSRPTTPPSDTYGEGEAAHRVAFAALKHTHEKVGDRWVAKKHKGPSDPRSKKSTAEARRGEGETFGGVDYEGHTKDELYERARKLGVPGRSRMTKRELARAIARKQ